MKTFQSSVPLCLFQFTFAILSKFNCAHTELFFHYCDTHFTGIYRLLMLHLTMPVLLGYDFWHGISFVPKVGHTELSLCSGTYLVWLNVCLQQ